MDESPSVLIIKHQAQRLQSRDEGGRTNAAADPEVLFEPRHHAALFDDEGTRVRSCLSCCRDVFEGNPN